MSATDIPKRGEIWQIRLNHETHYILIVSPAAYNARTGRVLVCLITDDVLGYPFEVALQSDNLDEVLEHAVVLADRVDNINWRELETVQTGQVTELCVAEVIGKLGALLRY